MRNALAALIVLLLCVNALADNVSSTNMDHIEKLKNSAIDLFNRGEYEKALPIFEEILTIDPNNRTASRYILIFNRQVIEPYCKEAAASYFKGNYPEAVAQWENILKINPNDIRITKLIEDTIIHTNTATIKTSYDSVNKLLRQEMYDSAITELEKILIINPADSRAQEMLNATLRTLTDMTINIYYNKADSFMKDKKYNLATEQWKKVLEIDPNQKLASRMIASMHRQKFEQLYVQARQLYEKGSYIESRDMYNKILAVNPTDIKSRKILKRLNEAVTVVPHLKERGKAWNILRTGMTHYIKANGNPRVAILATWYAVQLEPGNQQILAIRDFIEQQNVSIIRTLEPPVKDMNIIEQYLFSALNHIYEGRYDLAIQKCRIVLELDSRNMLALKRLGSAYYAMNKKTNALKTWREALKLSPGDQELKEFIRQAQ